LFGFECLLLLSWEELDSKDELTIYGKGGQNRNYDTIHSLDTSCKVSFEVAVFGGEDTSYLFFPTSHT